MYEFTDDCLTGIKIVDAEHRHLFELLNEAVILSKNFENNEQDLVKLIQELKDYSVYHFAHEEKYMEEMKDPELPLQRKEHALFVHKIQALSIEQKMTKEKLMELVPFLVRWLYHHIMSSDMMIGKMQPQTDDSFAFTDRYLTGVDIIDEEHKKLFEIIARANNAVHVVFVHDKYDQIMDILRELTEYTKEHFSDEEDYMESIGYDQITAQKNAHAVFIDKVVNIDLDGLEAIDENQQEYLENLVIFLRDWLVNHILKMDKRIGQFHK